MAGATHILSASEAGSPHAAEELIPLVYDNYTREKTVGPEPLGAAEADAAELQEQIDSLRRRK